MKWRQDQRDLIISQAMDLCANVDRFRQVVILTVDEDGSMAVVQKRRDDATVMEAIGMYRLMAADSEADLLSAWRDDERPMSEGTDD